MRPTLVIFIQIKPGVKAVKFYLEEKEKEKWKLCSLRENGELNMLIKNKELSLNINDKQVSNIFKELGQDEDPIRCNWRTS